MDTIATKTSVSYLTQIAWLVKDITVAERFFREAMGIGKFSKAETIRLAEFDATDYGEPCDAESLVAIAYSGGTFLELIQPLSGRSVFQDYIDKNPGGGVHHIAYSIPVANLKPGLFSSTHPKTLAFLRK